MQSTIADSWLLSGGRQPPFMLTLKIAQLGVWLSCGLLFLIDIGLMFTGHSKIGNLAVLSASSICNGIGTGLLSIQVLRARIAGQGFLSSRARFTFNVCIPLGSGLTLVQLFWGVDGLVALSNDVQPSTTATQIFNIGLITEIFRLVALLFMLYFGIRDKPKRTARAANLEKLYKAFAAAELTKKAIICSRRRCSALDHGHDDDYGLPERTTSRTVTRLLNLQHVLVGVVRASLCHVRIIHSQLAMNDLDRVVAFVICSTFGLQLFLSTCYIASLQDQQADAILSAAFWTSSFQTALCLVLGSEKNRASQELGAVIVHAKSLQMRKSSTLQLKFKLLACFKCTTA